MNREHSYYRPVKGTQDRDRRFPKTMPLLESECEDCYDDEESEYIPGENYTGGYYKYLKNDIDSIGQFRYINSNKWRVVVTAVNPSDEQYDELYDLMSENGLRCYETRPYRRYTKIVFATEDYDQDDIKCMDIADDEIDLI